MEADGVMSRGTIRTVSGTAGEDAAVAGWGSDCRDHRNQALDFFCNWNSSRGGVDLPGRLFNDQDAITIRSSVRKDQNCLHCPRGRAVRIHVRDLVHIHFNRDAVISRQSLPLWHISPSLLVNLARKSYAIRPFASHEALSGSGAHPSIRP